MNNPEQTTQSILAVDDVPANLNLLRTILEAVGMRFLGATSGPMALQIVQKTVPDLILLDVAMPEMDGFDVCKRLKGTETTRNIPVIFITARHEAESVMQGFQVGGSDYITKPFNKDEVLTRIRFHLENSYLHRLLRIRNQELEKLNAELSARTKELEEALANVKTLKGLVPICAYCKKIRDDKGFWDRVESYMEKHSELSFSHGICPECVKHHFPEYFKS